MVWDRVHLVLQHLGVECGDVERLHSVGQASRQHSIHVHTTATTEQIYDMYLPLVIAHIMYQPCVLVLVVADIIDASGCK